MYKAVHGGNRKHVKVCKKKISKLTEELFFHPSASFNCPYFKIGLCDLFPGLLEHITYGRSKVVAFWGLLRQKLWRQCPSVPLDKPDSWYPRVSIIVYIFFSALSNLQALRMDYLHLAYSNRLFENNCL